MEKVLLVGERGLLLDSRAAVLRLTGAEIVRATPMELETHITEEVFDLVVLCHSLGEGARRSATFHAHRRWPNTRVLQVIASAGEMTASGLPTDALSMSRPEEILTVAAKLLGRPDGEQYSGRTAGPQVR